MNKETKFYMTLLGKRNALQSIIQDTLNHIDDKKFPSTKDFFINSLARYEAKLETVNQIIEEYLNN